MEDQHPKLRALLEQKRKERDERKAKAAAMQQHKQTVKAVEHDTLRAWAATQTVRMQKAPKDAEAKDSLLTWKFEKQEF